MPHRRRGRFDLAMPSARAGAATVLHKRNQTGGKMITTEDRIRALPCWTGAIEIEPLQGGRIGLITGVERRNSYLETEAAYLRHAAVNGYEPVAVRIDECGGEEAAAEVAADLLRRMPDIAALCVPVDAFATGVLKAAKALNRPVPAGLRIATRYDGLRAKLASPPLTAVNLHLDQIAATAVDLLIAQLQNREAQPPVYLPPELVPRASSA